MYISDGAGSGAWVIADTIPEAPIDNHMYARQNAGWTISPADPRVIDYTADTSNVSPPPGSKQVKWNSVDQTLATELYFSTTDAIGRNVAVALDGVAIGSYITLLDPLNLSKSQDWLVATKTDNSNYFTFGVSLVIATGGDFVDDEQVQSIEQSAAVFSLKDLTMLGNETKVISVNDTATALELVTRSTYGDTNFYEENLVGGTNSTTIMDTALQLVEDFPAGMYDLTASLQVGTGFTTKQLEINVLIDGNIEFTSLLQGSHLTVFNLTKRVAMSGVQTCEVQYRATAGGTTVGIKDVVLRFISI